MPVREQLILLSCLIFLNSISTSLAAQNFYPVLTDIKCTASNKYAANFSCELFGPSPAVGANFQMQMKKAVKDFQIDLVFLLERMKKYFLVFKAEDMDVCVEFHKNITVPYVQMLKDMTLRAGKWPKCPIPENFFYKFVNISPDIKHLPAYLPQVAFKLLIILKDKKEVFLHVTILGKILHKKPLNGQKKN